MVSGSSEVPVSSHRDLRLFVVSARCVSYIFSLGSTSVALLLFKSQFVHYKVGKVFFFFFLEGLFFLPQRFVCENPGRGGL